MLAISSCKKLKCLFSCDIPFMIPSQSCAPFSGNDLGYNPFGSAGSKSVIVRNNCSWYTPNNPFYRNVFQTLVTCLNTNSTNIEIFQGICSLQTWLIVKQFQVQLWSSRSTAEQFDSVCGVSDNTSRQTFYRRSILIDLIQNRSN